MEKYKILMELNRKHIMGEAISAAEKEEAVSTLLNDICDPADILKYKKRMRVNAETDTIYPNYYIPHISEQRNFDLFKGIYRKPISYMLIIMNWKFFDYFICSNPKMKPFIKWLKTRSKDYKALVLAIHAPKANAWQLESVF